MARDSPDALRAAHTTLLAVLCGRTSCTVCGRTPSQDRCAEFCERLYILIKLSWRCCAVTRLARNAAMRLRVMRNAHRRAASVSQSQDDFFIVYRQ